MLLPAVPAVFSCRWPEGQRAALCSLSASIVNIAYGSYVVLLLLYTGSTAVSSCIHIRRRHHHQYNRAALISQVCVVTLFMESLDSGFPLYVNGIIWNKR